MSNRKQVRHVLYSLMLICFLLVMSCSQENTQPFHHVSKSEDAVWRNNEPFTALDGIASISVGRISDEAGYGWKPGISYAIDKNGKVWSWGFLNQSTAFPKRLVGLSSIQQLSGSYALTTDGQVWHVKEDKKPEQLHSISDAVAIQQMGEMFGTLYVLKRDGTVWQWDNETEKVEMLNGYANIRGIYGSSYSLFILGQNGTVFYLGGRSGEIRIGESHVIEIQDQVVQVAVNYDDRALIQTVRGEMYVFSPDDLAVERVPKADGAKRMAIGGAESYFIIKKDGTVWGWGENRNGILGKGLPNQVTDPVQVEGLADITDIQAGTDHVLALDKNGHVYSWGSNMTGQLGRVPVVYSSWTEIGELPHIQQVVTQLERPYFVKKDGSVWSIADDRKTFQVKGLSQIRKITSIHDIPITLNANGLIQIWTEQFTSSQLLTVPFSVKDIVGGEDHLLIRSADDRLVTISFTVKREKQGSDRSQATTIIPQKAETAYIDQSLASSVKSLYANHYTFFTLTEDGQVLFADRAEDSAFSFKVVPNLHKIVKIAPEYFVRYTLDPESVWALDETGRVHEIIVTPNKDRMKWESIHVTVAPKKEEGIADISGRLRITKDGNIFEHDWSPSKPQSIPQPIHMVSSHYDYAIEGPGSHYHLLVTIKDKIAVIGFNPFGQFSATPAKVVVP